MKTLLKKFVRDESGAALVEYGIALLVVILVGTGALIGLSNNTNDLFRSANNAANAIFSSTASTTSTLTRPTN